MSGYKRLVEYSVIKSAQKGDAEAISIIINHYKGYIRKLSVIYVLDSNGYGRKAVDIYLEKILELHLVTAILKFKAM